MKVPWLTCASAATLCFQVVADAAFEAHATDPVSSTLAGSYSANCAPVYASRWNPARLVGNAPPVVSASHTSFFGLSELGRQQIDVAVPRGRWGVGATAELSGDAQYGEQSVGVGLGAGVLPNFAIGLEVRTGTVDLQGFERSGALAGTFGAAWRPNSQTSIGVRWLIPVWCRWTLSWIGE